MQLMLHCVQHCPYYWFNRGHQWVKAKTAFQGETIHPGAFAVLAWLTSRAAPLLPYHIRLSIASSGTLRSLPRQSYCGHCPLRQGQSPAGSLQGCCCFSCVKWRCQFFGETSLDHPKPSFPLFFLVVIIYNWLIDLFLQFFCLYPPPVHH